MNCCYSFFIFSLSSPTQVMRTWRLLQRCRSWKWRMIFHTKESVMALFPLTTSAGVMWKHSPFSLRSSCKITRIFCSDCATETGSRKTSFRGCCVTTSTTRTATVPSRRSVNRSRTTICPIVKFIQCVRVRRWMSIHCIGRFPSIFLYNIVFFYDYKKMPRYCDRKEKERYIEKMERIFPRGILYFVFVWVKYASECRSMFKEIGKGMREREWEKDLTRIRFENDPDFVRSFKRRLNGLSSTLDVVLGTHTHISIVL